MILCPWKEIGRYEAVIPGLKEAVEVVNNLKSYEPAEYPLSCGKVKVQKGITKPLDQTPAEVHKKYLDIQYVLQGQEMVGWAPADTLTPTGPFDTAKDVGFCTGKTTPILVPAGYCYVVYPEDGHVPRAHIEQPTEYVKVLVKLEV